ncbi:MAG: Trm112 family protein [Candidatus Nanopelagicaceae bacterium]
MTVDPKILEIIVCPQCRGELALESQSLFCKRCALAYPIRNGIPVLLIDAATKRG